MSELGLIHTANNGTYYLLPVLQRSVEKLSAIVDEEMAKIGGQKLTLPILTSGDLWEQSGRLKDIGREVMTTVDRHNHTQILSPVNYFRLIYFHPRITFHSSIADQRRKCHRIDGHVISIIVQTVATPVVSGEWVGG